MRSQLWVMELSLEFIFGVSVHAGAQCMINTSVVDFRAVSTLVELNDEETFAHISAEAAAALHIKEGDFIRFAPVRLGE